VAVLGGSRAATARYDDPGYAVDAERMSTPRWLRTA
jgi:hypothetical protein